MSTPRVSVYIPTKNRRPMLERAVESVLAQAIIDLEIIIVDDGSTDDTKSYLKNLKERHGEIRVIRNDVSYGACHARNQALEVARGKYITGLDDDDEFAPSHIDTLLRHFSEQLSLVSTSILRHTVGGGTKITRYGIGEVTLDRLLHYNTIGINVLTLTQRMRDVGGFDEGFPASQDYDLWIRLVGAYGPGRKLRAATYIQHIDHGLQRISACSANSETATDLLYAKHQKLFRPKHLKSLRARRQIEQGVRLPLLEALKLLNRGNARMIAANILGRRGR